MNAIRNNGSTLLVVLLVFLYAIATYVIVQTAGGVKLSPDYSNTPNATVPGPPPFR